MPPKKKNSGDLSIDDWDPDSIKTNEELQEQMDKEASEARAAKNDPDNKSVYSWESEESQTTRYTFYATAEQDDPNSPQMKKYRRKDRKDPYARVLRQMLARARISRHHVDNLPNKGKLSQIEMTRGAETLYKKIEDRRPYNENYHWLPSLTEQEQLKKDVDTVMNDEVLSILSPKEQVLSVLRKNPMSPAKLDRIKRQLPLEDPAYPPPGLSPLNPKWKKQNPSHGSHKYFNYDGQWKNGKMTGFGRFCFVDGSTYDGEWLENMRHGTGTAHYVQGHVYEGQWFDDFFHGQGRLEFQNGIVYEGGFKEGKKHGKGVQKYPNGMEYRGDFKNGQKHGMGRITNKMGYKYIGEFKNDRIEGKGALYCPQTSKRKKGESPKRHARTDWPSETLSGLIKWKINWDREEADWLREEKEDLTWDLDAAILAKYIADVRATNLEIAEEKARLAAEKDRLEREERRQKMRQAKIAAQEMAASANY